MRRLLVSSLFLAGCSETPKVVLSRGTTPPRFLRSATLQEVVGYYGRTAESGMFEGTAVLMDYAYLRAFAIQQGRARFDPRDAIAAETRQAHGRYGGERTSFSVRFGVVSDVSFRQGDPILDLGAWSFRLRDGRGHVVRPERIEPLSPRGRVEVESHPTWGGAISYARHTYDLQGAVVFRYPISRTVGWVSLHAFAPGLDDDPLVFVWLLR